MTATSSSSSRTSSSLKSTNSSPRTSPSPPPISKHDVASTLSTRKRIRSVLMRAGTSRGLFFRLSDLPQDRETWGPILLSAMGSPDPFLRQLDGVGAGTSTTSKVAIVSPSDDPRADVDYLFVQVPVDGKNLDFSGNCGNMASGVGPFAVDEGFIKVGAEDQQATVRIRNVNTDRIIHSTFAIADGIPVEFGTTQLDGVGALGSPIRLDFIDPSGSMTGKLLPTGSPIETVTLPSTTPLDPPRAFTVSCVDAANPFIFVDALELGLSGTETMTEIATLTTATLMEIRAICAIRMGLARDLETARAVIGTPKIAIVGPPVDYTASAGRAVLASEVDLWVRPYSMGRPHATIQMTGAVCVGAASAVPGTLVNRYVSASRSARGKSEDDAVVVGHASGTMAINGDSSIVNGEVIVKSGSVYRTARRLMEGSVICMV